MKATGNYRIKQKEMRPGNCQRFWIQRLGLRRWVWPGYISRLDRRNNCHEHKEAENRAEKEKNTKTYKEKDKEKETGEVDKEFDTQS